MKVLVTPEFTRSVEKQNPRLRKVILSLFNILSEIELGLLLRDNSPFLTHKLDDELFVIRHNDALVYFRTYEDAIILVDVRSSSSSRSRTKSNFSLQGMRRKRRPPEL